MNDNTNVNPLFDPNSDNKKIATKVQKSINQPLKKDNPFTKEEQTFLKLIIKLVDEGKINLYQPSSLINHEVYDGISDEAKGKADLNAMNMLTRIRDIHSLMEVNSEPTYQVENMVDDLLQMKTRLEEVGGDLFII